MILNLGAGERIIAGAVNHDLTKHSAAIDVAWDLDTLPWPWPDDTFDAIDARSVFEHLRLTLLESLDECWRIIKPGGVLTVVYPVCTHIAIHDDPTHRWFWSERAIEWADPATEYGRRGYGGRRHDWEIVNKGVIKERNLKALLKPRGK